MSRLDHYEFDLAIIKGSRRKSVACHLFDDRPVCEKVLLRLELRREPGLQNAALPRVPVRNLKRYRLGPFADLLFGGLGKFPHTLFLCEAFALSRMKSLESRVKLAADRWGDHLYGPADLIDGGRRRDLFGLRQALRTVVRDGLRIADGLGQHLTQLSLRLRRLPHDRYLPVSHDLYVGMPEGELKPIGDRKNQ